jgi:hypothetical protein
MNNAPKNIEFYINIFYKNEGDNLIQTFQFVSKKRNFKYAFDKRFCLKNKIDKLINDENKTCDIIYFINRIDYDDRIVLIYKINNFCEFKNVIKNISFYLPPNNCLYCEYNKMDGDFIFCNEKKKHYQTPIKTCKIFKSIEEIIT